MTMCPQCKKRMPFRSILSNDFVCPRCKAILEYKKGLYYSLFVVAFVGGSLTQEPLKSAGMGSGYRLLCCMGVFVIVFILGLVFLPVFRVKSAKSAGLHLDE